MFDPLADDAGSYYISYEHGKFLLYCYESDDPLAAFDTERQAQNELARRTGERYYE